MKRDCPIIQDLYPLFIDDELQPEVRNWVDTHLQGCPNCREGFKDYKGFQELVPLSKEAPTETIDIRLTRWVSSFRIRIVSLITLVALIFAFVAFNQAYAQNREVLRWAIRNYERNLLIVENYFRYQSPDRTFRFESTNLLLDSSSLLGINLTPLERSRSDFRPLSGEEYLFASLTLLHYRAMYGYWNEVDQNYAITVGDKIKELREAALRLDPGSNLLDRFIAPLSLEELAILLEEILQLGDNYWLTNSLPGTTPLPDSQLTQILSNLYPNTSVEKIYQNSSFRIYSLTMDTDSNTARPVISVWQNIYTGQICRVMGSQRADYWQDENEVSDIQEFLTVNFGPATYTLRAIGGGKYRVVLTGSYPVDTEIVVTWNNVIKAPINLESPLGSNLIPNNLGDLDMENLAPEEAQEKYPLPEGYEFSRVVVIHSAMTGRLELAYEYLYKQDSAKPILLNKITGQRDFSYSMIFITF